MTLILHLKITFFFCKQPNPETEKDELTELPNDDSHIPFIDQTDGDHNNKLEDHHDHPDGHGNLGPEDEVDALPENLRYNWFDLLCTLISIGKLKLMWKL